MSDDDALRDECLAILAAHPGARVERDAKGWLVAVPGRGAGHTAMPGDNFDPRVIARRLISDPAPAPLESPKPDAGAPAAVPQPPPAPIMEGEDLGAEMLEAEEETAPVEPLPAYPGVAILPDEIGALRNHVIAAISEAEEIRIAALSNRWPDLTRAFQDSNNLLPSLWTQQLAADREEFMRLSARETAIRGESASRRRSARDAGPELLRAMATRIDEGWP